jgi:hypothetical protein
MRASVSRIVRARPLQIAATAAVLLVVAGVGVAVASSGDGGEPEAVNQAAVDTSPTPTYTPETAADSSDTSGSLDSSDSQDSDSLDSSDSDSSDSLDSSDSDSSDSGEEDATDESAADDESDESDESDDETDDESYDDETDSEPAAAPAPAGSLRGVWWSPGGNSTTSSRLWVFDGSGNGYQKDYEPTGIDGPFQYQHTFTYEPDGSGVRLSVGSVTSVSNHEMRLSGLDYDSSADTLSVDVDGYAETWYGCASNRQPLVAVAAC